jgi:hypothetical protein
VLYTYDLVSSFTHQAITFFKQKGREKFYIIIGADPESPASKPFGSGQKSLILRDIFLSKQ